MSKKRTSSLLFMVIVCVFVSVFSTLWSVKPTHADGDAATEILKKAMVKNMKYCYANNAFVTKMKEQDYKNNADLMSNWGNRDGQVYIPNMIGNSIKDGNLSCLQVLDGYNRNGQSVSGIFALFNKSNHPELSDYGYSVTSESSDDSKQGCIYFKYRYTDETSNQIANGQTNEICVKIDADGNMETPFSGNCSNVIDNSGGSGPLSLACRDNEVQLRSTNPLVYGSIASFNARGKWSDVTDLFVPSVLNQLYHDRNDPSNDSPFYTNQGYETISTDFYISVDSGEVYQDAVLDKAMGPSKLLTYLTGSDNFTSFGFDTIDKYHMYTAYLNDAIKEPGSRLSYGECSNSKEAAKKASSDGIAVRNGSQWCALRNVSTVSKKYNGAKTSERLEPMDFSALMAELMNLNYDYIEEQGVTVGTLDENGEIDNPVAADGDDGNQGANNTPAGETSTLALCYQSAGPLGWVICPVIKAVGEATEKLYEFIENTLQIQANAIMAPGGPVYEGWSAFRNFANILFAIAFAIIILAQVTGLGVSNYNIKKILPRLIMVAVLVNISFILCQLAVDVSNLVGFSAKKLFDNLTITGGSASINVADAIGSIASIATITAATVTIAGVAVTAATLSFWLIPLVVSLFGMLIGVLFFFLTLGARQAGIIVLVILSPVAIVCYALPNTKSLFDRWKKIFWALLLVYPICGILMGGGNYAGSILLSVANNLGPGQEPLQLLYAVIGMLITVVPFFMIPSLLKSSMAMMGNLGAKISNFGNSMRGGLTRGIRGSRAFQEHQAEEQRRLNYQRDQTRVGRLSTTGKGGGLIGRARRRLGMNDNLNSRQVTRAALAQSNIDSATDTTAQALRARWESDGTANDFENLTDRYTRATERLFSDPTDRDAIEEQKAAAMLLAAAKPGRGMLRKANNSLGEKIAAMTDEDQQKAARQVMQRSANNLLRTNSGDIAKSPLLDEQISSMQLTDTDYGSLNATALTNSISKINARAMSDMSNADLKDYLKAAASGGLDDDDFTTLATAAQNTLSDPRYQGQIKADARKTLNQLADLRYRRQAKAGANDGEIKSTRNANMVSLAGVNDAEFDRIRDRLKSGQMKETDATGVEQDYGTEMMDLMGHALMRTMDANDDFNLSASRATQISQVLQENGYDLSSIAGQYGITDPGQIQEKLDVATGMKVPRVPRQTLSERHANWQRATEAQASASGGRFTQGEWINTTTGRKLNQKDTMEAELLEKRDLEAQEAVVREKIERDDTAYIRSRTPIPVPPSNPPTPPTPRNP